MPEYGRNIQKMVDHLKTIDDREERTRLAHSVVSVMGNLNPHLRDINDFKHKLWDHLAIIANFELDIDYPYEVPKAEMFEEPPRKVEYGTQGMKFRHYGRVIEKMAKAVSELDSEEDKEFLTQVVANHMKKSYLTWNRESVDDDVILNDLKRLCGGTLDTSNVKLADAKDLVSAPKQHNNNNQRGKRKGSNQKRR